MMKLNKKAVAVITVLMMLAFCLIGCGGNKADSNNNAQQGAAETRLIFASGGTSGTYYPVAGAIAQVWANNIEGLTVGTGYRRFR